MPEDRLRDTMRYINTILGPDPTEHLMNMLRDGDHDWDPLSSRISLGGGWRGIKKDAKTQRRRAKRAYMLLLILLEEANDVLVNEKVRKVDADNKAKDRKNRYDFLIRTTWADYNRPVDYATLRPRLNELSQNVYNFMRRYPVLPMHGKIIDRTNEDYGLVTIDGTGRDPLIERMVLTPTGPNQSRFKLNYAPRMRQVGVQMYFLPWQPARIVRMTLGAASNVFFTAGLSGCSVFVEGNANSPTVYHAGVEENWKEMGNTVSQHVRAAKRNNDIPLVWRELFWDKSTITQRGNQDFGEINKTYYRDDGSVEGRKTTTLATGYHNTIQTPWERANFEILDCSPWGCVFGIRHPRSGNWAFYLQQNVTVQCRGPNDQLVIVPRVLRLTRFFPGHRLHFPPTVNPNRVPNLNDPTVMQF